MRTGSRHNLAFVTRMQAVALTVLVSMLFVVGSTSLSRVGADDLTRFEQQSGIDLPAWYGDIPTLLGWTRGDGTAFVTLGTDPMFEGPASRLLSANYRFQRVGLALAGRVAVLGNKELVPVGLLLVNLVAAGWYAARVVDLAAADRRLLWLLANPALYLGVAGSTAETLGLALALVATTSASHVSLISAFLLGTVRADYATVLPAGKRPVVTTALAGSSFLMVSLVGQLIGPGGSGMHNFVIPFTGYWEAITARSLDTAIASAAVLAAYLWTALYGMTRVPSLPAKVAWVVSGSIGLCLSVIVMNNPINLLRAAGALPILWALDVHRQSHGGTSRVRSLPSAHG